MEIKTNVIFINNLILKLKEDLNEYVPSPVKQDIKEALKIIESMKTANSQCRGYSNGHCKATANLLSCKCNGDKDKCDFYKMKGGNSNG